MKDLFSDLTKEAGPRTYAFLRGVAHRAKALTVGPTALKAWAGPATAAYYEAGRPDAIWNDASNFDPRSTTPENWDARRRAITNALIGSGSMHLIQRGAGMGTRPLAEELRLPSTMAGISAFLLAPAKDLLMGSQNPVQYIGQAAKKYVSAAPAPSSAPVTNIIPGGMDPRNMLLAGGLTLGGLALMNHLSNKDKGYHPNLIMQQAADPGGKYFSPKGNTRGGLIRVRLDGNGADPDTEIELPISDIDLTKTRFQTLRRDVKRRLREDAVARTRRRPDHKEASTQLSKSASHDTQAAPIHEISAKLDLIFGA